MDTPSETDTELDPGLRTEQAARILTRLRGVVTTAKRMTDWRFVGKGPKFIRRGRLIFYRREELEKWAEMEERGEIWNPRPTIEPIREDLPSQQPTIKQQHPPTGHIFPLIKTERDGVYKAPAGVFAGLIRKKELPTPYSVLSCTVAGNEDEFWDSTDEIVVWEGRREILIRLEGRKKDAENTFAIVMTDQRRKK